MSLAPPRARTRPVGTVYAEIVPGAPGRRRPHLAELHCTGAVALRSAGDALYLVGAGAHPIGGDETTIQLVLADGACVRVTSVGATLARKGLDDIPSSQRVELTLGADAALDWSPEPGIAAAGSRHRTSTVVQMARTARCSLAEEIVLGRHGEEPSGSWTTRTEVLVAGRPVLVSEIDLGSSHRSWRSCAGLGAARALASLVVVDPFVPSSSWQSSTVEATGAVGVALPLAGPGIELLAWADTLGGARTLLERLRDEGRQRGWLPPRPVAG